MPLSSIDEGFNSSSTTTCEYEIQTEFALKEWMRVFPTVAIGVPGIVSNIIIVCLLLRSSFKLSTFNRILICLACSDAIFILGLIYEAIVRTYPTGKISLEVWVHFVYPVEVITLTWSFHFITVLAVERYLVVTHPFSNKSTKNSFSRRSSAWKKEIVFIPTVFIAGILLHIPTFFEYQVVTSNITNEEKFVVEPSEFGARSDFKLFYAMIAAPLFVAILPWLVVVILNCKIYRIIQKKKRNAKANVLFAIVINMFICSTPIMINQIYVYAIMDPESPCRPMWAIVVSMMTFPFATINSSANFLIYFLLNKNFRKELESFLKCQFYNHSNTKIKGAMENSTFKEESFVLSQM